MVCNVIGKSDTIEPTKTHRSIRFQLYKRSIDKSQATAEIDVEVDELSAIKLNLCENCVSKLKGSTITEKDGIASSMLE